MAYVPNDNNVFAAALAGAMASMVINDSNTTNQSIASYNPQGLDAVAFAESFDTQWFNAGLVPADLYEVFGIQTVCLDHWKTKRPNPNSSTFNLAATWDQTTKALLAIVRAGDNAATGQGIVIPAFPSGSALLGGDVTGPSGANTVVKIQNVAVPVPPAVGTTLLTDTAGVLSWAAAPAGGITQLTGDVVAGPGSGAQAATVNQITGGVGGIVPITNPVSIGATAASAGFLRFPYSNNVTKQITVRNSANNGDYNVFQTITSGGDSLFFGDGNANYNAVGATINELSGGNYAVFNNGNPNFSVSIPGGVNTFITVSDGKRIANIFQQNNNNAGPFDFNIIAGLGFSGSPGLNGSKISVLSGNGGAGTAGNDNGGSAGNAIFGGGDGGNAHGGGNDGNGGNAIIHGGNGAFAGGGDTPGNPGVIQFEVYNPARTLRTVLQVDSGITAVGVNYVFGSAVDALNFSQPVSTAAGPAAGINWKGQKGAAAQRGGAITANAGDGGTTGVGGNYQIGGGFGGQAGVAGGSVQMLGTFSTAQQDVLVETVNLTATRRVVALCMTGAPSVTPKLTAATMGANTGDGVIFIQIAQTSPTSPPAQGFIFYVDTATGNLMGMGANGIARLIALA